MDFEMPVHSSVGIGFAIPSNIAKSVVANLIEDGVVHRGWLGVSIQGVSDDVAESLGLKAKDGALVASVTDGSPALNAGLQAGDVVLKVDDTTIKSPRELSRIIAKKGPRAKVDLTLWRDGRITRTSVALGEMPGTKMASADVKVDKSKAKLGLYLKDTQKGVVIAKVLPGSPAAQKGLVPGDVIEKVGTKTVKSAKDVRDAVASTLGQGKARVLMLIKNKRGNRFVAIRISKSTG